MDYVKIANLAALNTKALLQVPGEIIPFMEYLDTQISPKNILELGVCNGGTFYIWCNIAQPGGVKLGIDLPNGPWGAPYERGDDEINGNKHAFQTFAPNAHILFEDSKSEEALAWVKEKLNGELLDFLFIDADHSYGGASSDYGTYSKLVRPGGVIALHDIKDTERHRNGECHVYKLWNELEGEKIEFIDPAYDWGGIGVIKL